MRSGFLAGLLGAVVVSCSSSGVPGLVPETKYVLSGTVTEEEGRPLPWVGVVLDGSPLGTVAGENGAFAIEGVRSGAYGLAVVQDGFRSAAEPLVIPGAESRTVTLPMVRDPRLGPALADSLAPVRVYYEVRGAP